MTTTTDRLAELEAQRKAAQDEIDVLRPTNAVHLFADKLHERYCRDNHTDGCHWQYERSWESVAHARWAKRAHAILNKTPNQALVLDILDAFLRGA